MEVPGIGPLVASALVACVPDPAIFRSGRNMAAWLGLVPRQNSSGGKERLGSITKAGNRYLRQMLFTGAMAVIRCAMQGTRRKWLLRLLQRRAPKAAAPCHYLWNSTRVRLCAHEAVYPAVALAAPVAGGLILG